MLRYIIRRRVSVFEVQARGTHYQFVMEGCIYSSGSWICIWKAEHTSGGLRELTRVLAVWVLLAAGSQWAPFIYTARGLLNLLVCRPVVNVCSLQLNYGCYETVCKEFMATEVLNIPNIAVWTEGSLSLKGPGPDIYSEFGMNQQSGSEESCI